MASPLKACRVLDLTDAGGVFCTKVLAALGADVIRVEPPGGDPTRRIGPFYHDEPDPEKSLHWLHYNLNKRSVTLNIESATGQELFRRLAGSAQILVECFTPGYMDKLGLGYTNLKSTNPGLVYTSITPFGSTGPYSGFKSSNLVTSAVGGFLYLCGDEDRPPVQMTTPAAYVQTGLEAASVTLIAYWHKLKTGRGQYVDVSAQEAAMAQTIPSTLSWKSHGIMPHRSRTGAITPGRDNNFEIFKCKDGYVLCATTIIWGRKELRKMLMSEGAADDLAGAEWDEFFEKGATLKPGQKQHIDAIFAAFALNRTKEELTFKGQKFGAQVAREQTISDLVKDPHLKERGYFVKVAHPELNDTLTFTGAPFKSDEMAWSYTRRAPLIGEHNAEIYSGELGLSQTEMAALKEAGVI